MQTYTRNPEWTVEIRRPDYTKTTLTYQEVYNWTKSRRVPATKVVFVSSQNRINSENTYGELIEYEYDSTIVSPADPFSLTLVPDIDINGLTWRDKIQARDIVFISEFGKVRYIGVVKGTSYQSSMNGENPLRRIIIRGESIGGMLERFILPMNVYLWDKLGVDQTTANLELITALSQLVEKDQDIRAILNLIKDNFINVALKTSGGFRVLLDEFLTLSETEIKAFYPIAIQPYQEESNTLWSIFRMILPQPTYEIFGRYEEEGSGENKKAKYNLIVRETPFDLNEWNNLTATPLDPLYLIDHQLSNSDDEVFTHYYSQMPNAVLTEQQNWANNSLDEVSILDDDKKPIYGFRQLSANFPFYNKAGNADFDAKEFLKENSVRLYAWYRNNDEFLSGSITMHTVPKDDNSYIQIGEKIEYMKGSNNSIQFYVEGIKRRAEFMGIMSSTFTVTRGYEYNETGKTVSIDSVSVKTPQIKKVETLGRKLQQVERGEYRV